MSSIRATTTEPTGPTEPAEPGVPAAPVRSLLDAVRQGDGTAFAELFGDDGAVDDWGRVFTGRDQVDGWSRREFIGLGGQLEVHRVSGGGLVLAVGIATTGGYNGPATLTFTLADDGEHISRMLMTG